jgi:acetoin utilization deacetylase AcuC-like enzyme
MQKYRLLRDEIFPLSGITLTEPHLATFEELTLAHAPEYVESVFSGRLSSNETREIGFPWSEAMVERARRSVGATIGAASAALQDGIGVNLAGGTHHAQRTRGSGFCVFNDVAVAARWLQREGLIERALIVDLDVHQGNGTAQIFREDSSVFTMSLHGEKNFPFRKEEGDLDVGLPDGTGDAVYLEALQAALGAAARRFDAQVMFFLAGADPHENDRLGRLNLTTEGLRTRDELVFKHAEALGIPVAVSMAGGYGRDVEETVAIHCNSIKAALLWQERVRLSILRRAPTSALASLA